MKRIVLSLKSFLITGVLFSLVHLNVHAQQKQADPSKAQTDTSKYTIENCINEFNPDKIEKTKAGYQYWFIDKDFIDGRTIKLSVVGPHKQTHAPHTHPEDEFFFILEGKAEFYLNGKTKVVGPNTSLYCPSNVEHGIKNAGDSELKYLVIKRVEDNFPAIDISVFFDSAHHWYDIFDQEKVVNPLPGKPRYKTNQITKIADNILLYQKKNGGWPKNYDMLAILTKEQIDSLKNAGNENETTFDNGSTYSQIEYLAQVYSITKVNKYKDACIRGIEYVLNAQYPNGGWPQFYPDTSGYRKYITLNDGAMTGVMKMLNNIVKNKSYYSFIDNALRQRVKSSLDKAVDCLLKCQIIRNGMLTAWCQQHDHIDLHPQSARNFEPPAICSRESAVLIDVLMDIDNPGKDLITSIKSAVEWLESSKLMGIKVDTVPASEVKFIYRYSNTDKVVVEDPKAPPIWSRFYEIETNKPLFCNRDKKVVYSMAEVERERRDGYGWYTYEPAETIKKYQGWKKKYL